MLIISPLKRQLHQIIKHILAIDVDIQLIQNSTKHWNKSGGLKQGKNNVRFKLPRKMPDVFYA